MALIWRFSIPALILAALSGCGPSYSPDTYASNAVQQANKVEQGTVVGVRPVGVSAAGTVGTLTGAAAGGIAGSQAAAGPISAFTALGGSLVGGIAGSAVEHTVSDTAAFEYIVRKANGDLVSVTQKDKTPLALGQKVLVIAGNQARVVPDYTVPPSVTATKAADAAKPTEAPKTDSPSTNPDASAANKPADAKPADTASVAALPAPVTPPAATKPGEPKPADASSVAVLPTTTPGTPEAKPAGTKPPDAPIDLLAH